MRRSVGSLVSVVALLVATALPAGAVGAAPFANYDFYSVKSGRTLNVAAPGILTNDLDPENDQLTAILASPTSLGTVILRPDGSFRYKPNVPAGLDQFSYTAFDGTTASSPVSVFIKIDSKPVAEPDSYKVIMPGPRIVIAPGVLANDTDADHDGLTAELVRKPSRGTLALNPNGSFSYTPSPTKPRDDFFVYRALDPTGQKTRPTRVDLTLVAANSPPVAEDDTYQIQESTGIETSAAGGVLANDTDLDGDILTAEVLTFPFADDFQFFEDGSFWYYPPGNWDTDVTFTYRVTDGTSFSPPATVTIDIVAVNSPPTGEDDQYSMLQDDVLTVAAPGVLANDHDDVEFDGAHVHDVVQGPGNGDLVLNTDGSFTYTPDPGFNGVDGFTYRPADSSVGFTTFVTIEVLPLEGA